jgi:hypothetical protein
LPLITQNIQRDATCQRPRYDDHRSILGELDWSHRCPKYFVSSDGNGSSGNRGMRLPICAAALGIGRLIQKTPIGYTPSLTYLSLSLIIYPLHPILYHLSLTPCPLCLTPYSPLSLILVSRKQTQKTPRWGSSELAPWGLLN